MKSSLNLSRKNHFYLTQNTHFVDDMRQWKSFLNSQKKNQKRQVNNDDK